MDNIIFGPVPSRRLGRSLGVNIVPSKICSLDCVYCEVGRTKALTVARKPYISVDKVLVAFSEKYPLVENQIDVITITGAGEPTLNTEMSIIVDEIRKIADKPVAILTNSTTITDSDVYESLKKFDIIVPSLDAALQSVFEQIDIPESSIKIEKIVESLQKFSKEYSGRLFLEILFVKGINDGEASLDALIEASRGIVCEKIQLGTVFRPPAVKGTAKLSVQEMEGIFLKFAKAGLNVEPVGIFSKQTSTGSLENSVEFLISLLSMRPVTLPDIAAGLSVPLNQAESLLAKVKESNTVISRMHDKEEYYSI